MKWLFSDLDQSKIFYFSNPIDVGLYYNDPLQGLVINYDRVNELADYSLVLADFSTEHWGNDRGTIDFVYSLLEDAGINFIMLSHDYLDHLSKPKLLFYPYWYHQSKSWFPKIYNQATQPKKYKFSCLNGTPRFHRIYYYLKLLNSGLLDQGCISMYQRSGIDDRLDDYELPIEIQQQWAMVKENLPCRNSTFDQKNIRDDANIVHPAYSDSYINVVTETVVLPKFYITEKTWKPIANGQLFLIIGTPGTIQYLRHQGVDTYDDIIDHNYYDSKQDWQERINCVHRLLEDLLRQDLYQLYCQTQQRRLSNAEKYFNGAFDLDYHRKLYQCINTLN